MTATKHAWYILIGVFAFALLLPTLFISKAEAYAPICHDGSVVVDCLNPNGPPISTNGGVAEQNKCYELLNTEQFGPVYFEADCNDPKFGFKRNPNNIVLAGVAKCSDGTAVEASLTEQTVSDQISDFNQLYSFDRVEHFFLVNIEEQCRERGGFNQNSVQFTTDNTTVSGTPPSGRGDLGGDCKGLTIDKTNCGIIAYAQLGINVLSAVVGIVIVIMIAYGGIKYTISRDNAQETAAAKQHIINALIALVLFLFTFALLQWLIPGGAI